MAIKGARKTTKPRTLPVKEGSKVKGGFSASEVSKAFAGQAALHLIGTLLERCLWIMGFSEDYQQVRAVLPRCKTDDFVRAVGRHSWERIPAFGDVQPETPFGTRIMFHLGCAHKILNRFLPI